MSAAKLYHKKFVNDANEKLKLLFLSLRTKIQRHYFCRAKIKTTNWGKKIFRLEKVQQSLSLKWNRMPDKYFSVFLPLPLFTYIPIEYFFRTCLSLFSDLHFLCKFIAESYSKKRKALLKERIIAFYVSAFMLTILWLQITSKNVLFCDTLFNFPLFCVLLNWICLTWFRYRENQFRKFFFWILYSIYKLRFVLFLYYLNIEMKRFFKK